jgi:hypothetical protein
MNGLYKQEVSMKCVLPFLLLMLLVGGSAQDSTSKRDPFQTPDEPVNTIPGTGLTGRWVITWYLDNSERKPDQHSIFITDVNETLTGEYSAYPENCSLYGKTRNGTVSINILCHGWNIFLNGILSHTMGHGSQDSHVEGTFITAGRFTGKFTMEKQ